MSIAERVRDAFQERFGEEPDVVAFAPGRINLIGEHTDYNDGFVFPVAIDKGIAVAASRSNRPGEMYSLEVGEGESFDVDRLEPGSPKGWTVYPAGMAWALRGDIGSPVPNLKAVVHGDLPVASGVSSSAAIEVAFGKIFESLAGFEVLPQRLAKIAQVCEIRYVGVSCGIMDMTASACGKEDHAMLLDTRSLEIRYVPVPSDIAIVLCDTSTPRALTSSAYNERRSQCEAAAAAMGVSALRDANLDDLQLKRSSLDPLTCRRALHVITENERCLAFVEALTSGGRAAMGRLLAEGHASLRDDYEVSSPELDAMVEAALSSPGCIGARMIGAGFGGACVALVDRAMVPGFLSQVRVGYANRTQRQGSFVVCRASAGAHLVR